MDSIGQEVFNNNTDEGSSQRYSRFWLEGDVFGSVEKVTKTSQKNKWLKAEYETNMGAKLTQYDYNDDFEVIENDN